MTRLTTGLRTGWIIALCCLAAARSSADSIGPPVRVDGVSLGSIDPSLVAKIGFRDPSYAALIGDGAATGGQSRDGVDRFIAPDGRLVTVDIQTPTIERTYDVPPISPGQDPAAYFTRAVAQAGPHVRLVFPKAGIYHFGALRCRTEGAHLKFTSAADVVIDGNGSLLDFPAPCAGISLVRPMRVVLTNFTIDWPTLQIASLGTITSRGGGGPRRYTYDLQLDGRFVSPALPATFKSITAWDADRNSWALQHPGHDLGYQPPQALARDGSAHDVPSWSARFEPGERVLVRHYTTEGDAVDVIGGEDVTLSNVTVYASPGFGFAVLGSSGFALSHCSITRSAGRPISTAADGLHIDNLAHNVRIENNTFAFQGDDGLNINATAFKIAADDGQAITVPARYGFLRRGDVVALFDAQMRRDDTSSWRIADLAPQPVNDVTNVTLDRPIPAADRGGFFVDLADAGAGYVVRNNRFLNNRARGALLQTPYGLVEGNAFSGQTLHALLLTVYPPEGPGAQDVMIARNTITDGGINGGPGAITLARGRMLYGPVERNPPVDQNIIFMDNVVHDVPGPAFYVSASNDVVLYRNKLQHTNVDAIDNTWNAAGDLNFAVVINDASNMLLKDNTIDAVGGGRPAVFIDRSTTTGIVTSSR